MTRFINTTLIGLVAFFAFLAVLWLFVDPAAPGLATQDDAPKGAVRVTGSDAQWVASDLGTRLAVDLDLRNTGPAAAVTQVAYRVTLDGQLLAASSEDPPATLPADSDGTVRFNVELPATFAGEWWRSYATRGESSTLRVDGTVTVRAATSDQRVPFQWQSAWNGDLVDRLSDSPQECPGPPAPMCLDEIKVAWKAGRLQTTIVLRNDQSEPVIVRNGTFRLVFEDVAVAGGRLEEALTIAPGEDADITAQLAFDDGALMQWWAGHVARCETSRLSLDVGLETEGVDATVSQVDWDILAAPYRTAFACSGGA